MQKKHFGFYFVLFIILLFANSACQKFGHGSVNGHVLELGTDEPIANAKIEIQEERYQPGGGITSGHRSYKTVASTVTDSKGEYQLYFRKHFGRGYQLNLLSTPQHASDERYFRLTEKNVKHDFIANPFGYVKFRIKKNSVTNRKRINVYSFGWHIYIIDLTVLNQLDTILPQVYNVAALKDTDLFWMVTENLNPTSSYTEITHQYQEKIYVNKSDTILRTLIVD